MNAQKLTQKSLEAIQQAQDIATEYQNNAICPEHLCYALLNRLHFFTAPLISDLTSNS